jgi:hypothetical protein
MNRKKTWFGFVLPKKAIRAEIPEHAQAAELTSSVFIPYD